MPQNATTSWAHVPQAHIETGSTATWRTWPNPTDSPIASPIFVINAGIDPRHLSWGVLSEPSLKGTRELNALNSSTDPVTRPRQPRPPRGGKTRLARLRIGRRFSV